MAGSFEGVYRANGYEAVYAVKLAVAEQNAQGGIAGRSIELVSVDDSGSAERARAQAAELAADRGVLAVVGHTQLDTTQAALAEYAAFGLPVVAISAWTENPDPQWVFAAAPSYWQEVSAALREAGVQEHATVAVLSADADFAARAAGDLPGWQVVAWDGQPSVQAIVLAEPAVEAAERTAALGATGIPLVGGSDLASSVYASLAEAASQRVVVGETAVETDSEGWQAFRQAYKSLAGADPGRIAALAYDAARVILDAMARAAASGDLSRGGVARALRHTQLDGLTGALEFGADSARLRVELEATPISEQ